MGIHTGSQVLYSLEKLSFSKLHLIASARAEKAGRQGSPAVAVDLSWLCFKERTNAGVRETSTRVKGLISSLLNEGIGVVVVCDPNHRHHSKKASIARDVKRERSLIDAIHYKTQLLSIKKMLRLESYETVDEKKILIEQRKDMERKVKTSERDALSHLSPDYIDAVKEAINLLKPHPHLTIVSGIYQADSVIQRLLVEQKVDIAIGNDADFSFVAGAACLQVTSFKLLTTKKTKGNISNSFDIKDICIASSSRAVIEECGSVIGLTIDENGQSNPGELASLGVVFKLAKYPLLDGIQDIHTRCLIGCILGSDTIPSELKCFTTFKKMGLAAIRDVLSAARMQQSGSEDNNDNVPFDTFLNILLQHIPKKNCDDEALNDLSKETITAFVDAMVYEPTGISPSGEKVYVDHVPTNPLSEYIKDFAPSDELVKKDCTLLLCPGTCPERSHVFIEEEGTTECPICHRIFCKICLSSNHCILECVPCATQTTALAESVCKLSDARIRDALKEKIEVPADASPADLQELYSIYVEDEGIDVLESTLQAVQYPTHPPEALDDGTLKIVSRFDFRDGARFLGDRRLSARHRCKIAILLSKLVTFEGYNKELPAVAEVLPDLLVQFAGGARVDSGERLMKRCVRHSRQLGVMAWCSV